MSIYVVFFGGYHASQTDMDLWKTSAEKQRDDVKFDAFPYPDGAGADDDDAVNGFKQFDEVIKKIEDTGADTLFIVGHSSGCAIANEVNSRLKGDHKNITLVDLDGFAPSADKIKKSSVQAWSAEGDGGRGHSLHWAKGKKCTQQPTPRRSGRFISPWSTPLRPTPSLRTITGARATPDASRTWLGYRKRNR
jgi:hypothetical protein